MNGHQYNTKRMLVSRYLMIRCLRADHGEILSYNYEIQFWPYLDISSHSDTNICTWCRCTLSKKSTRILDCYFCWQFCTSSYSAWISSSRVGIFRVCGNRPNITVWSIAGEWEMPHISRNNHPSWPNWRKSWDFPDILLRFTFSWLIC